MEARKPVTDTEWLDFLEVLGRTPPDSDGDWRVCFSKGHRNLREALAQTWENRPELRGAYASLLEGRAGNRVENAASTKPSEVFPPPSEQQRVQFGKLLMAQLALDEGTVIQILGLLKEYDKARTEVMDNYAQLAHEAVSVNPRPLYFQTSGRFERTDAEAKDGAE